MTPDQHAAALRAYAQRVDQLAHERVETAVRSSLVQGVPAGVSVMATRTPTGTRVTVFGPGARRYASSLRHRLTPVVLDAVHEAVR